MRTFRDGTPRKATRSVVQFAEASSGEQRAARTYRRALRWFSSCPPPDDGTPQRMQLVSTARVAGVGDQSALLVLRSRTDRTTYVVGVARSGLFTTITSLSTQASPARASRDGVARMLATAVGRLCALSDGGACAEPRPTVADRAPYKTGKVPWMISEIDLPPLAVDQGPWIGTPAADVTGDRIDAGAIGCDTARLFGEFRGQGIERNQFRTFVFDDANLPPQVGLTQTVGSLPRPAAGTFVQRFRDQVAACPDLDASAGTEVVELARTDRGTTALSAWHLTTALSGDRAVEYDVAVVRRGSSVGLLVYVAADKARIAGPDFVALARRALDRLGEMEPYGQG